MARVTVEDCLQNVKNRFELVIIASKRARQLMRGSSEPKVAWENDKPTVVALREIAMGYTDFTDVVHTEVAPISVDSIEEFSVDDESEMEAGNPAEHAGSDLASEAATEHSADADEASDLPATDDDQTSEISTSGNSAESE